jgi:hypothetical protein
MAVERVLSNLNLISFKTEGGLQNHIDELQDGDLVFTPDNSLKGNLFDFKWTDHKLNDISWLNADTFSWQSGDVYVAAYEHLVADVQGKEYISETIEGHTIWYRLADDGHKIVTHASDYDGSANVNYIYEATGVAWYYILDQENKRFKLPRTKFGFTGLRDSVGGYVSAGLPNITGTATIPATYGSATASGAFTATNSGTTGSPNSASKSGDLKLSVNASRSSSIYGNSDTVQPKATQMYLYFYVGNFERDALEQTAGLNTELFNEKADVDLSNLTAVGKEVCANMAMPSNKYVDLTLGASGTNYTAPADGWFFLNKAIGTANAKIEMFNSSINFRTVTATGGLSTTSWVYCSIPANKGDQVQVSYNVTGATNAFKFIYANGAK